GKLLASNGHGTPPVEGKRRGGRDTGGFRAPCPRDREAARRRIAGARGRAAAEARRPLEPREKPFRPTYAEPLNVQTRKSIAAAGGRRSGPAPAPLHPPQSQRVRRHGRG